MAPVVREARYWTRAFVRGLGRKEKSWRIGPDPERLFLKEVERHLSRQKKLLDIGCGTGRTIKRCAGKVKEAGGIDVSRMKIGYAREVSSANTHFRVADGKKLPFQDATFDVVISQRGPTTENEGFAREMSRVLKIGGVFVAIGIGEHDKENIKRIFGRGQLYEALTKRKTEAKRTTSLLNKLGFTKVRVKSYDAIEYFATIKDLVSRLEVVPIIPNFHRIRDRMFLREVERRLLEKKGIRTNSQRIVVTARKSG